MRRGPQNAETETGPTDPSDDLYRLPDRYKVEKKAAEEGNVTNSLAMLTAIPEVDLGMECVVLLCLAFFYRPQLTGGPQCATEEYRRDGEGEADADPGAQRPQKGRQER